MRLPLILTALVGIMLLASAVGWLVFRTAAGRIETTLAAQTRTALRQHIAGETLEGLQVTFDGLEGQVSGLVADADRRRRLAAAIDYVHAGNVAPLKGRVLALHNRLTAPASCEIIESDEALVLRGRFPNAQSHRALLAELERFAGRADPPRRLVDEAEVAADVERDAPWAAGLRFLVPSLLPLVEDLHLQLVSDRSFRVGGKVGSDTLKRHLEARLASQFPHWRVEPEIDVTVEDSRPLSRRGGVFYGSPPPRIARHARFTLRIIAASPYCLLSWVPTIALGC